MNKIIQLDFINGKWKQFEVTDIEMGSALTDYKMGNMHIFVDKDGTHYIQMNQVIDFLVFNK